VTLLSFSVLSPEQWGDFQPDTGNLFSFFPRAFHLMCDSGDEGLVVSHVLVVLIYNLALATHVCALRAGKMTQHRLVQIMNLYQNGLTLAQSFLTAEDGAWMLSVQLALTNNQGYVFSQGQWFSETRECLTWLMHLLELSSSENTQVAMQDYEIFFESVCVYLDGNDLCLAPAA
jgi:hypothetical protein